VPPYSEQLTSLLHPPLISTTLGAGWGIEVDLGVIEIDSPEQDVSFQLNGAMIDDAAITIRPSNITESIECVLDQQGVGTISGELLSNAAKERNLTFMKLGAYIGENPWPLATVEIGFYWNRILEIDVIHENYTSSARFTSHVPENYDITNYLPIEVKIDYINSDGNVLEMGTDEIDILPCSKALLFSQFSGNDYYACSITPTSLDGSICGPIWFMNEYVTEPCRRIIGKTSETIPLGDWFTDHNENLTIECEELHIDSQDGLQWNAVEADMSREKYIQLFERSGLTRELVEVKSISQVLDEIEYPQITANENGFQLEMLLEHNLQDNQQIDYFKEKAVFWHRTPKHIRLHMEIENTNSPQHLIIRGLGIVGSSGKTERICIQLDLINRIVGDFEHNINFPELVLSVDDCSALPSETIFVAKCKMNPYKISIRAEKSEMVPNTRVVCEMDYGGCGLRREDCHRVGKRNDCGGNLRGPGKPLPTTLTKRILGNDIHTIFYDGFWYSGVNKDWFDLPNTWEKLKFECDLSDNSIEHKITEVA